MKYNYEFFKENQKDVKIYINILLGGNHMLNYILIGFGLVLVLIWMIRPLYNFFAKNKYVLLDNDDNSFKTRIRAGLPAYIFFIIIISFMFTPVVANSLIAATASGSVILSQLIIIFIITRYDKRQTKYKVLETGITYRGRTIRWDEKYEVRFKKTWLVLLHKPRFILQSKKTKIIIPMLSKKITKFIKALEQHNQKDGKLANTLYQNTRLYYIENIGIARKINKN